MQARRIILLVATLGTLVVDGAPVAVEDPNAAPHRYTGLLMATDKTSTAVVAAPGVIITAASAIYDLTAETPHWVPAAAVRFYPRYHAAQLPPDAGAPNFMPAGFTRWTSYYEERLAMEEEPPFYQIETYNVDFAAAWFSSSLNAPALLEHPSLNEDAVVSESILLDNRNKLVAGYPVEAPAIAPSAAGLMHIWPEASYPGKWEGTDVFFERDLTYSSDLWFAVYTLSDIQALQGIAGSPVFVRSDGGEWLLSGIVLAANSAQSVFVRGIDANAMNWIDQASFLRSWPGSGWLTGVFDARFAPWLIHSRLGWIHVHEDAQSGLYIWFLRNPLQRFLYTDEKLYPFFFDLLQQVWLRYETDSGEFGPGAVFTPVAGGDPVILE